MNRRPCPRQIFNAFQLLARVLLLSCWGNVGLVAAQPLPPVADRMQQRPGRVTGTVYDSLTMSVLGGASIWISGLPVVAVSDKKGKFVLDSVPAGRHVVEFSSAALDSAGFSSLRASVDVKQGAEAQLKLASPSLKTFWKMMCKESSAADRDSGIVYGIVRDGDNDTRLISAPVAFSWMNLNVKTKQFDFEPTRASATSDSTGSFYACGLPAAIALSIRAYGNSAASGEIEHTLNSGRISRIDFRVTKDLASIDNRHGRASVRGTVVGTDGAPVAGALVSVSSSDTTARTDSSGTFLLQNIPAGTQSLQVRKIGMSTAGQTTVDLIPERTASANLTMNRATVLGTVKVSEKATISVYHDEFLERRKVGLGKAIDFETQSYSDLFSPLLSAGRVTVKFDPALKTRVVRMKNGQLECIPRLYIDGALVSDDAVLEMRPDEIRVVEVFATYALLPARFMGYAMGPVSTGPTGPSGRQPGGTPTVSKSTPCGAIAWWTKKAW